MVFGDERGPWGATREDVGEIVSRFADAGGSFIDTASNYAGESERIVGELIAAERDRWVLATKHVMSRRPADPNVELTVTSSSGSMPSARSRSAFPHDFAGALAYGDTFQLIDDPPPNEPRDQTDVIASREKNHDRT